LVSVRVVFKSLGGARGYDKQGRGPKGAMGGRKKAGQKRTGSEGQNLPHCGGKKSLVGKRKKKKKRSLNVKSGGEEGGMAKPWMKKGSWREPELSSPGCRVGGWGWSQNRNKLAEKKKKGVSKVGGF